MSFYRFVSDNLGIYGAVERDCPRNDLRRTNKADGSWLPRVGERYPGAISFWKDHGLEKYLTSGLQEWHRSVLREPISVLVADELAKVIYEDDFQVICAPEQQVRRVDWSDFPKTNDVYPLVEKVVAYITDPSRTGHVLVFEHDNKWSEAGIQVPAGTVNPSEPIEAALFREIGEESGLSNLRIVEKIDQYVMFRNTHSQFNRRHVFLLATESSLPEKWSHSVGGDGIDTGMNFHFYWMPFTEAEYKLVGSFGSSISKIKDRG